MQGDPPSLRIDLVVRAVVAQVQRTIPPRHLVRMHEAVNIAYTYSHCLSIFLVKVGKYGFWGRVYLLVVLLRRELNNARAIKQIGRIEVQVTDAEWFQHG